jgi:hypothetical protein
MSDMSTWFELVKVLPGVVTAGTAIYGVCIARAGLTKWRREAIGKRKAELAEEVLADFYAAKQTLWWVRVPATFSGEYQKNPTVEAQAGSNDKPPPLAYIALQRLQEKNELFARIESHRYRFQALFSGQSSQPFQEMTAIYNDISTSLTVLMRCEWDDPAYYNPDQAKQIRDGLWSPAGHEAVSARIDDAIRHLEEICRPILKEGL